MAGFVISLRRAPNQVGGSTGCGREKDLASYCVKALRETIFCPTISTIVAVAPSSDWLAGDVVDSTRECCRAEAIVNVHDGHTARAAIEHR